MQRTIIWAAILGATAIALGALGAHTLKNHLTAAQLISFETGVRYQIYHALALLFVGLWLHLKPSRLLLFARNFIILGTLFFSVSIYLLNLQNVLLADFSFLGPITPIGGLLLIVGWILIALDAFHFSKQREK